MPTEELNVYLFIIYLKKFTATRTPNGCVQTPEVRKLQIR
jgi:hypothetical protein